jgi:hypothetical protein
MRKEATAVLLVVVLFAGAGAGYVAESLGRGVSTSTFTTTVTTTATFVSASSSSEVQGIVTGTVSVAGQTPANISQYSLGFKPASCSGGSCQSTLVTIYPSGHYAALLAPGSYTLWLYPSCKWSGCAAAFQNSVVVASGQQIVVNLDIANPS